MQQEQGGEGEHGHEQLKQDARASVDAELARRMEGYEAYETSALLQELQEMLIEYAAVVPGTREPINNGYRYHAEYVQSLLLERGGDSAVDAYMAQTASLGYIEKANPFAYRATNDNRTPLPSAA